jgi:hypothetical protein
VRSQKWRVISIARDFAEFSNQAGTALSMRRVGFAEGRSKLVLEAQRSESGRLLKLILEIDETTGRPLAEIAQVKSHDGSVEFRVVADRVESLRMVPASLVVFQPEVAVRHNIIPKPVSRDKAIHITNVPVPVDPRLLDDGEVQIRYLLHRAGLCFGPPLSVDQDKLSGTIRVTGLVESEQIKEQISSAILHLPVARLVRMDVKTVAEAAAAAKPFFVFALAEAGRAGGGPASLKEPIEALIDQSAKTDMERSELKRKAAGVSSELIFATETLAREAWALHRLGQRFPQSEVERLGIESRRLLAIMAHDHLIALDRGLSKVDAITLPFQTLALPAKAPVMPVGTFHEINFDFRSLVDSAEQINARSQSLFALSHSKPPNASGSVGDLLAALSQLKTLLGQAHQRVDQMDDRNVSLSTTEVDHENRITDVYTYPR